MNVKQYLSEQGVRYQSLFHRPTFDAQRMAQAVHVAGDQVAKTVVLRADGREVLAVLQATHQVDLDAVRDLLGAGSVDLAAEREFAGKFPDCELGALPPFGSQYGMRTLVDSSLAADEEIVFEGNTHEEAVRLRFDEYVRLEHPLVASFSHHD